MTLDLSHALASLYPNCSWVLAGRDYDGLDWKDANQPKPTEAELITELSRLQAVHDSKQYQRDRAKAYPSIQEQMDMQYWDAVNGTTVWQDTIQAIKAKYPKGV